MEQESRPDWKSSLRTVVFALLAVAMLLGMVAGKALPFGRQGQQLKADMLIRGGDTFMSMYYLAREEGWGQGRSDMFFTAAGDFYTMALEADPESFRALLSTTIMLRLSGRMEESAALVPRLTLRDLPDSEHKVLGRVAPMILFTFPSESAIEAARDYLFGFGPGPALVANSYREIQQPEKAAATISEAARLAIPALRAVAAVTALNATLALVGVIWLVTALLSRRRGKSPQASALVEGFGLREAVEALIVWLFLAAFLGALAPPPPADGGGRVVLSVLAPAVAAQAGALLWIWLVTVFRVRFGWRRDGFARALGTGIAAAGVALVPALSIYALLQDVLRMSPADDPVLPILAAPQGWAMRVVMVAVVGLVVPALEETLFRGLLFGALRRVMRFWPAAAASALLFAVVHMNAAGVAAYFVLGLTFAAVFERTRSLFAAWAAHATFNLVNLAMVFAIFG